MPYLAGATVIIIVVGWLIITSIDSATAPYLTVTELLAEGPSDRIVRATGTVVGSSIDWNAEELLLRFDLTDDADSISVGYSGTRPDLLEDGIEAVVEGRYQGEGRFEADAILLKCPSKYEEE
ncbi:cytochrome c maturation protein CcmE [Candidatus Bipolaricaulota bacterium]